MGAHSAGRGEPSWSDTALDGLAEPVPNLPAVSPVWAELEQTRGRWPDPHDGDGCTHEFGSSQDFRAEAISRVDDLALPREPAPWRPSPRPHPTCPFRDFTINMEFLHSRVGPGFCGCGTKGCDVRAQLDRVDWGPDGPPLPPARLPMRTPRSSPGSRPRDS